jgi:hypothetical protein
MQTLRYAGVIFENQEGILLGPAAGDNVPPAAGAGRNHPVRLAYKAMEGRQTAEKEGGRPI